MNVKRNISELYIGIPIMERTSTIEATAVVRFKGET
jgi:hypothetical protein